MTIRECNIKTIDLNYMQLQAKCWGETHQPSIIALHGWLDNAASFDRLAPLLKDYYVIAVDLPGHGFSQHRAKGSCYYVMDYVRDVIACANYFSLDNFILMGHSLGAIIACILAGSFTERVDKLLLIDGIGAITTSPEEAPAQVKLSIATILQGLNNKKAPYDNMDVAIKRRMMSNDLSYEAAQLIVNRGMELKNGKYFWRHDNQLFYPSTLRLSMQHVEAFLQNITAETLFLRAVPGIKVNETQLELACRAVNNLTSVKIDSNHYPHLEKPKQVANILNDFIEISHIKNK